MTSLSTWWRHCRPDDVTWRHCTHLTRVRIQMQQLVASRCISPNLAIILFFWMFNLKIKNQTALAIKQITSRKVRKFYHLQGHGNEAYFPRFLHKSVQHWFLTLHFKPFRFWLQIRRDIHNLKTTRRLSELGCRQFSDSKSRLLNV